MSRYPFDVECDYAGYLGTGGMRQLGIDQAQLEADRCDALIEQMADTKRAEYEAEFGEEYRAKHPFKIDHNALREQALEQLRKEAL